MEVEVYSFTEKWIATTPLLLTSFFTGIFQSSFPSTLIDFKEITNTTMELISLGITMRSAGGCLGASTSSLLYAKSNEMVVYSTFIILMGAISILMANITNLIHHLMLQFAIGFVCGVADVGSTLIIFTIWQNSGGPFLQSSSFAWTLSGVISPLIFESFLSTQSNVKETFEQLSNSATFMNGSEMNQMSTTQVHFNVSSIDSVTLRHLNKSQSHIWIPYTLVGAFVVIAGLMTLTTPVYRCLTHGKRRRDYQLAKSGLKAKEKLIEDKKVVQCSKNKEKMRFAMLCGFFLFIYYGLNDTTWQFWLPFVMNTELRVSKSDGVYMLSAMNVAVGVTNFLGIIAAATIHPFKILVTLTSLIAIGNWIHLIFANSSLFMLKLGALVECAGFGCMYAALFNYAQREVGLSNKTCSALVLCSYLASAVGYSAIVGRFVSHTPMILIQSNLLIVALMVVCLCSLKETERRILNRKLNDLSNEFM